MTDQEENVGQEERIDWLRFVNCDLTDMILIAKTGIEVLKLSFPMIERRKTKKWLLVEV